jgi:putative transposase
VIDIFVQSRSDKKAARKFFRKLLKDLQYMPRVIITDKLSSAARAEVIPGVEHRHHKGLNNRAENSHKPTRLRERVMREVQIGRTHTTISLSIRDALVTLQTEASPANSPAESTPGLPATHCCQIPQHILPPLLHTRHYCQYPLFEA